MTPNRSHIESPNYAGVVAEYLGLLRELAAIEPPLFVFGSVAEAVLLDGELSETHGDVDVAIPRTELGLRLRQLAVLGFDAFNVYYEPRPGLPLVYGSARGDLALELSLVDFDPAGIPSSPFVLTAGRSRSHCRPTSSCGPRLSSIRLRSTRSAHLRSFTCEPARSLPAPSARSVRARTTSGKRG